jgi:peptide/nickel transport system substrate-binding protein
MMKGNRFGQRRAQVGRIGRRTVLGAAATGSAALLLAACGGSDDAKQGASGSRAATNGPAAQEAQPKPGGVLREATITQAPHFSPFHPGADPSTVNFWRRTYGYYDTLWGLKEINQPDRLHLRLAASFEQPDPATYLVTLNKAAFHNRAPANGREVVAEDVAAAVEFIRKPPASGGAWLQGSNFKGITAVDSRTVRYEGAKPYAFFLEVASPVIVPREMLDEKTLKEQIPVGSGPYQYKAHMQGSTEEIARYEGFRVDGRPYIAERRLTFVPDEAAMEVAFRAGQIDVISQEGIKTIKQKEMLQRDLGNRIVVQTLPSTNGMALLLNVNRSPWNDVRVREAVYRAIDVQRVIEVIYLGDAERTWYFSKARFTRDPLGPEPVMQYISQDSKKAAELLRASGIDLNKEYEFMVPAEEKSWVDAARLMGEDLVKVGLRTRINPVVRNIYLQRAGPKPGDFDISMSVLLDYQFAQTKSGSFWDSASLQDAEVDAQVEKIRETVDAKERAKLSHEFETMLARKYSNLIPILSTNQHFAWYTYVKGVDADYLPVNGYQAGRWIDK